MSNDQIVATPSSEELHDCILRLQLQRKDFHHFAPFNKRTYFNITFLSFDIALMTNGFFANLFSAFHSSDNSVIFRWVQLL